MHFFAPEDFKIVNLVLVLFGTSFKTGMYHIQICYARNKLFLVLILIRTRLCNNIDRLSGNIVTIMSWGLLGELTYLWFLIMLCGRRWLELGEGVQGFGSVSTDYMPWNTISV